MENSRPLRIAVVGSGPSGFYAAEALLKQAAIPVQVDMFDRLPTPYGLVRGGVAPDHQKIKSVVLVYEKVAASPHFHFFGNVMLGRDLQAAELLAAYDQVVYAVGNESDRRLGIAGEDLAGNYSATEFVGWYNGHPDHREKTFDLSQESVAVIGIGNVAMDVTRILAEDPEELAKTDIAGYALDALRQSRVKEIFLLGRRGPAQAAYSPAEIQEIGELKSADLVVRPEEVVLDELSKAGLVDPADKKNVDYVTARAARGEGTASRKVRLRFCMSPVEVLGQNGRTTALKIEKNALVSDGKGGVKAQGTGQFETVKVGLVFRSVGYRGVPIAGVPFDEKAGKIPNAEGRVLDAQTKAVRAGEYVVGWAKRGPSGLIGTNRADSVATVKAMLEDASPAKLKTLSGDIASLLRERRVRFVTFADWKRLDALEIANGQRQGKIREKFSRVAEMLDALKGAESPIQA